MDISLLLLFSVRSLGLERSRVEYPRSSLASSSAFEGQTTPAAAAAGGKKEEVFFGFRTRIIPDKKALLHPEFTSPGKVARSCQNDDKHSSLNKVGK